MTVASGILTVRLDERTERELQQLVEHFTAQALGEPITQSQVARVAIHSLHDAQLGGSR